MNDDDAPGDHNGGAVRKPERLGKGKLGRVTDDERGPLVVRVALACASYLFG